MTPTEENLSEQIEHLRQKVQKLQFQCQALKVNKEKSLDFPDLTDWLFVENIRITFSAWDDPYVDERIEVFVTDTSHLHHNETQLENLAEEYEVIVYAYELDSDRISQYVETVEIEVGEEDRIFGGRPSDAR